MSKAIEIRQFLHDLLGSRLTQRLEEDLLRVRSDFQARLQEREQVIADLRNDRALLQAKCSLYEHTLMPLSSKAGADVVAYTKPKKPNFGIDFSAPAPISKWQQVVQEHEKELAAQEAEEKKQGQATAA